MVALLQLFYGISGIVLLYYGAGFLVKGGSNIAARMRISPLVIGLTLVAFGTSAPELVVSLGASFRGMGDISVGNVVGSNICNIALILGLSAMITPLTVNPKLFRLDLPLLLVSTLFSAGICLFYHEINRWVGLGLTVAVIAYTWWSIRISRKETETEAIPDETIEKNQVAPTGNILLPLGSVAVGLFGLIAGAQLFLNAAIFTARALHVSEAVIGLTVVAVGTSLPELATSVVAAIHGEKDIAVGNVVGSNLFNILAILGITSLINPISAPGVDVWDFAVFLLTVFLLYPMMRIGLTISRWNGLFLFLIYVSYTAWLIYKVKVGL